MPPTAPECVKKMFALGDPHLPFSGNPRVAASDASATGVAPGSGGCSCGLPIGLARGNSNSLLGNASDSPPVALGIPPAGACVVRFVLSWSPALKLCLVHPDNGLDIR